MKPIRLAMLGIIAAGTLCGRVSTMAAPASIPSKPDADSSLVTVAGGPAASGIAEGAPTITGPAAAVTSGGSGRLYVPIRQRRAFGPALTDLAMDGQLAARRPSVDEARGAGESPIGVGKRSQDDARSLAAARRLPKFARGHRHSSVRPGAGGDRKIAEACPRPDALDVGRRPHEAGYIAALVLDATAGGHAYPDPRGARAEHTKA